MCLEFCLIIFTGAVTIGLVIFGGNHLSWVFTLVPAHVGFEHWLALEHLVIVASFRSLFIFSESIWSVHKRLDCSSVEVMFSSFRLLLREPGCILRLHCGLNTVRNYIHWPVVNAQWTMRISWLQKQFFIKS